MKKKLIYSFLFIILSHSLYTQNQDTVNTQQIISIVQDSTYSDTPFAMDSTKSITPDTSVTSSTLSISDSIPKISTNSIIDYSKKTDYVSKKMLPDSSNYNVDSLKIIQLQDSILDMQGTISKLKDSIESIHQEKLIPEQTVKKKITPLISENDENNKTINAIDIKQIKVDSLIKKEPKRKIIDSLRFGPWKLNILAMLTGNQYYYKNWNAGGENSISLSLLFKFGFNYTKNKNSWSNLLTVNYGSMWLAKDKRLNKTDDIFSFTTNYAYNIKGSWSFSFTGTFLTQFDKAYSSDLKSITSNFMAPAYLTTSFGFEYKFKNKIHDFKITVAPVTGKTTFVIVDTTQTKYNKDTTINMAIKGTNFGIREGQSVGSTIGSLLTIYYKVNICKQISLAYNGQVFYGYFKTNQYKNVPDLSMDLSMGFKITKHLQATLYLGLIYDYKVRFNRMDVNGNVILDENGEIQTTDKVQFKETFGLSLTYKI